MKDTKIRNRMMIGFSIILVLLIGISIFSISRMYYLANFTTNLYWHPFKVSNAVLEANIEIVNIQRIMRELMLEDTSQKIDQFSQLIDEHQKHTLNKLSEAKKYILLNDKTDVDKVIELFNEWRPLRDEQITALRKNDKAKAVEILKIKAIPFVDRLTKSMNQLMQFASKKALEFYQNAENSKKTSVMIVVVFDFIALVFALLISYWLTISITRPLSTAMGIADRLSRGDISIEHQSYSKDETGRMLDSMSKMAANLREQMRQITEGINTLASSAVQISAATSQLATTTQEVSSSVNEVVVSMKEVKQTTSLSNEKAKEMAERARGVVETSRGGETAVRQTIDLINTIQEQMISIADSVVGLSDQSQSIGEIIAAVDDVADQSRLLAINASIEAVKAGEQGKGFTVVAEEIKNLAEQSKQSTSQVRTILTDIQKATSAAVMATEKGSKAVENGVKQAGQTGGAIQTLGENINQTSQAAMQIEATSRQQAAGIDQVFVAMESISNAISQNADSARQLENSARDLDNLGKKLKSIVERYNI